MIDAWGKIPARVFLGNLNWYGAYDECNAMEDTHYCLSYGSIAGKVMIDTLILS